jgi:type III secretion system YscI/HrpB-like protein
MTAAINLPTISSFKETVSAPGAHQPESNSFVSSAADNSDFQAMFDGNESGESRSSVSGVSGANGVLDMVRSVDSSKGQMQSALMTVATSADPENIFRATAALSKYDLQTLFLSKVASKAFQAVDRLTNLQ